MLGKCLSQDNKSTDRECKMRNAERAFDRKIIDSEQMREWERRALACTILLAVSARRSKVTAQAKARATSTSYAGVRRTKSAERRHPKGAVLPNPARERLLR